MICHCECCKSYSESFLSLKYRSIDTRDWPCHRYHFSPCVRHPSLILFSCVLAQGTNWKEVPPASQVSDFSGICLTISVPPRTLPVGEHKIMLHGITADGSKILVGSGEFSLRYDM